MTETLQSTVYEQHSMSSQAGNLPELNSYSNLRPNSSFIVGSDPDHPENNSSRQEQQQQFAHHPTGATEMGLGFMTNLDSSDDSRYTSDAGATQHQSHYSSIHDSQVVSTPSSVPFFQPFPPNALSSNASQYSNPATPYLNSNPVSNYTSYSSSLSDMVAPSLGAGGPVRNNSPTSRHNTMTHAGLDHRGAAKSMYGGSIPSLGTSMGRRYENSPPQSHPMSPSSSSGFQSPQQLHMDSPHLHGSGNGQNPYDPPPLNPICRLQENISTADGTPIRPDIIGKIDKGFFLAENDWTCYRRNYFQVSVSYTLNPMVPAATPIYINLGNGGGQSHQIQNWAMTISAVVDNEHGKPIELVMHTPKRDKGPQLKIEKQVLAPRSVNMAYHTSGSLASLSTTNLNATDGTRTLFDPAGGFTNQQPPACEHTFERIQFKQATANNGKRRARQQYYHLMLELWVDLGAAMGDNRWKKIAYRASPPMVVRGRSPGHYHAERRGSNASGGASGPNGNMQYGGGNGSIMGRQGDMGRPGSMIGQGGTGMGYYPSGVQQARDHIERFGLSIPPEPIMTQDEEEKFLGQGGYTYYPGAITEPNINMHSQSLPTPFRQDSNGGYGPQRIKQEYQHGGYGLPSPNVIRLQPLNNGSPQTDSWGRQCGGRFEGVNSTRGYYPSVSLSHNDVNAS